MDAAATNENLALWTEGHNARYPSCGVATETRLHILLCREGGCVGALARAIVCPNECLKASSIDLVLQSCLVGFFRGRREVLMSSLTVDVDAVYQCMAWSQDSIGWTEFFKRMISKEVVEIQAACHPTGPGVISIKAGAGGVIMRLLETVHGQWIYRNTLVHDRVMGVLATARNSGSRPKIFY